MLPRIPVIDVEPVVEGGAYPAKAAVGEPFAVSARVFREGHDLLGAGVVFTDPAGTDLPLVPMVFVDNDLWAAQASFDQVGPWTFRVESWSAPYDTWEHDATVKIEAGVDVEVMLTEGALLLGRASAQLPASAREEGSILDEAAARLQDTTLDVGARLSSGLTPAVKDVVGRYPVRDLLGSTQPYPFFVDRELAVSTAWYEFFPRSEGAYVDADGTVVPGTLRTAAERLPAVAAMGFDVIYLPPIHPIGRVNRKGPNNTLVAGPGDPGSPWGIGSAEGGHDAVHPDLGTIDDLDAFVARADELGLEVALDFALQCAPDHPWVAAHPEWFTTRNDGTIAFAENPPKKYQDIYPLNFDNDPEGIYAEILRVLRHWMSHGVRVFRVDNPHTKPVGFWDALLSDVRRTDPDVIFLAEAFTKPTMMRALGTVGYHQSYTYFTWRNTAAELAEYLVEVSHEKSHVMRPSFWVNTPDILPTILQHGGPDAFRTRAVLAATGSPSWGVYAGFELMENTALRPGGEEYLDSEKFQVRVRDWAAADAEGTTLAPYLTRLNEIRRSHPALRQLANVTIHESNDERLLVFSKKAGDDVVLVVVNTTPWVTVEATLKLDQPELGLEWGDHVQVEDEMTGERFTWGEYPYVKLGPTSAGERPVHVLALR
ncbi:MAG: alpha-1,4-glucan--maltose-1-phosphate maltosyltransferase [Nocardioidaceae bacterium]|nr:alpha-1,4-glucan--maltose-1-phosphate maltosyltransferase [Nocardioidaceae bacterium]